MPSQGCEASLPLGYLYQECAISSRTWLRSVASTGSTCERLRFRITPRGRSEEHTSELQSLRHLVCRLLLEKKKNRGRALRCSRLRQRRVRARTSAVLA